MKKMEEGRMKILFINGSPNRKGNTAALAEILLQGKDYETLNLTDSRGFSGKMDDGGG